MITLEGYRQANPYVEYQRQASDSYNEMMRHIRLRIFQIFYQIVIQINDNVAQMNLPEELQQRPTTQLDNKEGELVDEE